MKVLIVGSGGREHALAWKIKQSSRVTGLYALPGSSGIAQVAECVTDVDPDDFGAVARFAREREIDLTVVGPEAPLVNGIVGEFHSRGLRIFGPNKKAALLEGDKGWAKGFCRRNSIPTPRYEVVEDIAAALRAVKNFSLPVVIKASGLAAGKGVMICADTREVKIALQSIMGDRIFGSSGNRVVIEEYLTGEELTVMALCDGTHLLPLIPTQDHKKAFNGDKGPNTGGMGAYGPPLCYTPELQRRITETIFTPFLNALKKENITYKGVVYFGLMLTPRGPQLLEFNVRFGDPEAQVVLPLLDADLVTLMEAVVTGDLAKQTVPAMPRSACCVVLAAGGYPGPYERDKHITGLDRLDNQTDAAVFHAGTVRRGDAWYTAGGRVLGITVWAPTLRAAVDRAYALVAQVGFDGMHARTDIGWRSLSGDHLSESGSR